MPKLRNGIADERIKQEKYSLFQNKFDWHNEHDFMFIDMSLFEQRHATLQYSYTNFQQKIIEFNR